MRVDVKQFAEFTNADGLVSVPVNQEEDRRFQWLTVATTPKGRLAYLGFYNVWHSGRDSGQLDRVQAFAVTDRPVYRPGQQVHMKVWVARAKYDGPMQSEFAHKTFQLEIHDPKGERVLNKQVTANAYGGIVSDFELPTAATLGQYRFHLVNYGGGTFRVEEYKKPEFEVTIDAPSEPLELGEKFDAKITARYYFGEPVREGTIKYKVTRTTRDVRWFPVGQWDWLYGPGYWWFGHDYAWYPGWQQWGSRSPSPWWIWRRPAPPEIVAEGQSPVGDDGTLSITIDSSLAKELHPDKDHEYRVEAEVTDRSRRTIVGTGTVLAARKPFEVYAWTDRGFYRTGETIVANFQARRPDGKPVTGTGKLRLFSVDYSQQGKPLETEVRSWDLNTNAEGRAELQIKASDAGQYRLSYQVTSESRKTIEGAHVLTIVGNAFDGSQFRFDDLELVPDKRHYEPGDKLQLQVNTNRLAALCSCTSGLRTACTTSRKYCASMARARLLKSTWRKATCPISSSSADGIQRAGSYRGQTNRGASGKARGEHRSRPLVCRLPARPGGESKNPPHRPAGQSRGRRHRAYRVRRSARVHLGRFERGRHPRSVLGMEAKPSPPVRNNLDRYSFNIVPPGESAMQMLGAFGYLVADESSLEKSDTRNDRRSAPGRMGGRWD